MSVKVTLITVNYNGADKTIRLLDSLKDQTDKEFKVIVVDNFSADRQQIEEYTRSHEVSFIKNKANLGFAAGNNPGLKQAFQEGADWAVLINNDTWVEPSFIARLKASLEAKEGLVGLPLREGERTAYAGRIEWFAPTLEHAYSPIPLEDAELHYPIGGGMAISQKAHEILGGLSTEYFLYFEDVDYAMKARESEVPISFAIAPAIQHDISSAAKKLGSPLLLRYHYRNAAYFNFKRGSLIVKVLVWPWSLFVILKQLFKIARDMHAEESKAIVAGLLDFYQSAMGKISMDKIRVGVECENLEDGQSRWGVGQITLNLLEEFARNPALRDRYELYLYFKHQVPPDEIFKDPILKKVVLGTWSFNLFYHLLLPVQAMRDRVDWMFFPAYMLPPAYLFGSSVVMLTGDVYHEYKSGKLPFRYRLAYGIFTNWAAKFATKILAISESSKKEVTKLYKIRKPEKVFVSRLGVKDIPVTLPNTHGDYMLFVGQMFPRRHALESILAFERLAPEFPELKFILVGKDKAQPLQIDKAVKRINEKLGSERIVHYDYIESTEEVRSLYAHAKLFVYVSDNEAFGLPPVEAASYGTPIAVKNSDINHELFEDAAFFVDDPKDIAQLAETFTTALTDTEKRDSMKKHNQSIASRLNWHEFTARFFDQLHA